MKERPAETCTILTPSRQSSRELHVPRIRCGKLQTPSQQGPGGAGGGAPAIGVYLAPAIGVYLLP